MVKVPWKDGVTLAPLRDFMWATYQR